MITTIKKSGLCSIGIGIIHLKIGLAFWSLEMGHLDILISFFLFGFDLKQNIIIFY